MPSLPARRRAEVALALLLLILGWVWIVTQHQALWLRLPDSVVERYVSDRTGAPLDAAIPLENLQALCTEPPSLRAGVSSSWARDELAACLNDDTKLVGEAPARDTLTRHDASLLRQMDQARGWLHAFRESAPARRAELLAELARIRNLDGNSPLQTLGPAIQRREPIDPPGAAGDIAANLEARLSAAESNRKAVLDSTLPVAHKARALGLLATGKRIAIDFGDAPPSAHFANDRQSLAEGLEWLRRGQGYARRGFSLEGMHAVPLAIAGASVLILIAAVMAGNALLPWVIGGQLLGVGALVLSDVSLTGAPALRYLADRQFVRMGVGDHALPLMWQLPLNVGTVQPGLWLPLMGVALVVLLLGALRSGKGAVMLPIRKWVQWGSGERSAGAQALALLVVAVACVLLLGMPAAISELLIFFGCIGVAGYVARQAPHANAGAGLQWQSLLVVSAALLLAIGGALLRGDLGHALVASVMAAAFFWLFGNPAIRLSVAGLFGAAAAAIAWCRFSGKLDGPLGLLAQILPNHARERMAAMIDPWHAASSDLARTRWLIESARDSGWGPGLVPWQGILADGAQAGLPLQGPSDYVLSLMAAEWGLAGGFALLGLALATFAGAAFLGLRSALRPGMPPVARWLTAIGGFGCIVMAAKTLLSLGGVAGLLPLTGLPVALLGYGAVGNITALLYLALALGCRRVVPLEMPKLVKRSRARQHGAVRLRSAGLAGAVLLVLGLSLVAGFIHLATERSPSRHLPQQRYELAQAVAAALVAGPAAPAEPLPCAELQFAVEAWNRKLAAYPMLPQRHLDPLRLLNASTDGTDCPRLARSLGGMLNHDLPAMLPAIPGAAELTEHGARIRQGFQSAPRPHADPRNYLTANAFWGVPGCVLSRDPAELRPPACVPGQGASTELSDPWLQQELGPRLQIALHEPASTRRINGHETRVGPELDLSLASDIQALAQQIADCQTGLRRGEACLAVAPRDEAARKRFEAPESLRAGALGIVVAEVDSGRIVALAGAVSDCSLDALNRSAGAEANGRIAALGPQAPCARLPDKGSRWLLTRSPALWLLPPGSALKELGMAAAIHQGLIAPADDKRWKGILAESHDNESVQRITLASGQRYLTLLAESGFGEPQRDILRGTTTASPARWTSETHSGHANLAPAQIDFETMQAIRHDKEAGINIDKRYGHAQVKRYLAARLLADSVVGGADLRISALGLAETWRRLDLRARGRDSAPAMHLLEQAGQAPPVIPLGTLAPSSATRAIAMTTGITASAWKGTAQGSCRVVFGQCPPEGLPDLAGKTGTADFLDAENSPWVKPGLQLPAKLFGGVFSASGKRYSVAVMALRVREAGSRTLELRASAPAEAALTLIRQMRTATQVAAH